METKVLTNLTICPFCTDDKKALNINPGQIQEHLIITVDTDNHWHIHGPISNKLLIMEMIRVIAKQADIKLEG